METTQEKVEWLQSFCDLLASPKFTQDKNAPLFAEIRKYSLSMLTVFEHELWEEQAKNGTLGASTVNNVQTPSKIKNLPHLSDNFPKEID